MLHIQTPLLYSITLSQMAGANIWLKMEALQPCGSFKARGIGHACTEYVQSGATQLISSSGGNAGLAVAYSGRKLGIPVTVVVPEVTPQRAIDLMRAEGAVVLVHGESWFEAHGKALTLAEKETAAYIHPFDDPYIWEGHATLVDELVEEKVPFDGVVLSVGGGGLMSGVIHGLQQTGLRIPLLAVETEGANSLHQAMNSGQLVSLEQITTVANTLGAKQVASEAFMLTHSYPVQSAVVSDKTAVSACLSFLDDHRLLVEPACGASLSTVYDRHPFLADKNSVLVIVCGGAGVTLGGLERLALQTGANA